MPNGRGIGLGNSEELAPMSPPFLCFPHLLTSFPWNRICAHQFCQHGSMSILDYGLDIYEIGVVRRRS